MAIKKINSNKPPIDITNVEHLPDVLAVCFWGRSGTGKTTVASTFPKPLLLLDVREKGTDSISNVKGVRVGQVTSWTEFESVYWYLEKGQHDYKTVVVDQITSLQDLAMEQARRNIGETRDPRRLFGEAGSLMKTWLLNYRDLIDRGVHVVFIAHDRVNKGEEGGDDQIEPEVGPRVMPSVATFLNGSVKIIGNSFIRETFKIENKRKVRQVEYGMRLGPHAFYTTKVRSPVGIPAPDHIVNPTFDKLLAVMRGEYSTEASTVKRKIR
jgi:hypothetical protein